MESLRLEIITPERIMVQEEVEMLEARGAGGEFGVLPGHTQFLSIIYIGEVRYTKGGQTTLLSTGGGIAEIQENNVTLLLDTAEFAADIDVERARRAMEREEEAMKRLMALNDPYYKLHELALMRAIARIGVAAKKL